MAHCSVLQRALILRYKLMRATYLFGRVQEKCLFWAASKTWRALRGETFPSKNIHTSRVPGNPGGRSCKSLAQICSQPKMVGVLFQWFGFACHEALEWRACSKLKTRGRSCKSLAQICSQPKMVGLLFQWLGFACHEALEWRACSNLKTRGRSCIGLAQICSQRKLIGLLFQWLRFACHEALEWHACMECFIPYYFYMFGLDT